MRVRLIGLIVPLCLTGCTAIATDNLWNRDTPYAYGVRPLQPNNCGTPDRIKPCHRGLKPAAAATPLKAAVTIEELGGAPAVAASDPAAPGTDPE